VRSHRRASSPARTRLLSDHRDSCFDPLRRQYWRRFYALEFIAIEVFDAELLPFELFDWLPCVRVHHQKHAYIHLRVWEMQADLLFVPLRPYTSEKHSHTFRSQPVKHGRLWIKGLADAELLARCYDRSSVGQ